MSPNLPSLFLDKLNRVFNRFPTFFFYQTYWPERLFHYFSNNSKSVHKGKKCWPGILEKLSRAVEARILCSTRKSFSKHSLRGDMRMENANSCKSAFGNEASAELNHVTVARHTLTKSKLSQTKCLEIVSRKDFFPSPRSDIDKFNSHSFLSSSSSPSYICS